VNKALPLLGIAWLASTSCGRFERYDYAEILNGPKLVGQSCGYRPPLGATDHESDAFVDACFAREPLDPDFEFDSHDEYTLTGAVDEVTGMAELEVTLFALPGELERARLFIDGELADTSSRAEGTIGLDPRGLAVTTLVGWTPPPSPSYLPWEDSPRLPEWRLEWEGSDPAAAPNVKALRSNPFVFW